MPPDNVTLRDVAETTGGRFFAAPSAARLEPIYENLGTRFSTKRRRSRRSRRRSPAPRSSLLLGGAACSRCCGRGGSREPPPRGGRRIAPERDARQARAPGPIPPTVLRSLDLAVLRRVESLIPGEHLTPQVGGGTELALIRPYRPGDDVRHIDWNVTARCASRTSACTWASGR